MLFLRLPLWSWCAVTILLPLSISLYIALPYYQVEQQDSESFAPTYTVLEYPEFETEKLPMRVNGFSLTSSNNENIPSGVNSTLHGTSKVVEKKNNPELDIADLDLSGLSPELAARFEFVLNAPIEEQEAHVVSKDIDQASYLELDKRGSQLIGRLPPLNFQTHNYTSKPSRRWVKVNDKEVNIGGSISNGVILLEINPRDVVIEFQGKKIEVPALYEWKG